jgi:hypothetical protein
VIAVKVLKTVDNVSPSNDVCITGTSVNTLLIMLLQAVIPEIEVNEKLHVAISFSTCNTDLVKAPASQYSS